MQIVTQEGKPNSLQIAKKHQHNNDRKTVLKHTKEEERERAEPDVGDQNVGHSICTVQFSLNRKLCQNC